MAESRLQIEPGAPELFGAAVIDEAGFRCVRHFDRNVERVRRYLYPDRSRSLVPMSHSRTSFTSSTAGINRSAASGFSPSGESTVMMAMALPPLVVRARLYSAMLISRSPRSRADSADDARHVLVDDVEQLPFRLELDAEVVDGDDALRSSR